MLPQVMHLRSEGTDKAIYPATTCSSLLPGGMFPCRTEGQSLQGSQHGRASWPRASYSPPLSQCQKLDSHLSSCLSSLPDPNPVGISHQSWVPSDKVSQPGPTPTNIYAKPWNRNAFPSIEISAPAETTAVRQHGVIQPRQSSH